MIWHPDLNARLKWRLPTETSLTGERRWARVTRPQKTGSPSRRWRCWPTGPGSWWGVERAEAILRLRAVIDTGDFEAYWRFSPALRA